MESRKRSRERSPLVAESKPDGSSSAARPDEASQGSGPGREPSGRPTSSAEDEAEVGIAVLRARTVSGGAMPGLRAQRICQGGTSGPSSIASGMSVNMSQSKQGTDAPDSHRTTQVRSYMHTGSSVRSQACVWIRNCHPPRTSARLALGCSVKGTHTCDSITQHSSSDRSAPGGRSPPIWSGVRSRWLLIRF